MPAPVTSTKARLAAFALLAVIAVGLLPAEVAAAETRTNLPLAAGRSNYLNSYRPATVARNGSVVTVSGLIRNTALGLMANLPAGMRPQKHMIFNLNVHDNTARVDVYPNGEIRMNAGNTGYGWISLDGIVFPVTDGNQLPLQAGWRNYGQGFSDANATLIGNTVYLGGMVIPGSGNTIARLPANMRPAKALIFNVNAFNTTGRVDILPTGEVNSTVRVGGAKWVSLGGIVFERNPGQPLSLAGGWSPYGQQYAAPTVKRVGNRVVVSGLARASTNGWGQVATLPKGMCPESRLIFNLNNHERTSRIDVISDCRIMWVGGGHDHGWLSLDGMAFDLLQPAVAGPTASTGGGLQAGSGSSRYTAAQAKMVENAGQLIQSLKIPGVKDQWNTWADKLQQDGALLKLDVKLFNQKATIVVYRPKGRTAINDPVNVAVLIDNAKISNLIAETANTVADDLQVNKATYIYVPKGNEEFINTSDLPQPVRGFVEQVRTGPIDILSGHNMFALFDTRDGGETAKFLKQVGVPLDHLKVNASYGFRKSRETGKSDPYQAVRLMRPGWWEHAFNLESVRMKDPTFEYAKLGNVKVFRGWGTSSLYNKEYFLFAQKTGSVGPYPTAVAMDAESITLKNYIQLATLFSYTLFSNIPQFQNLAARTDRVSAVLDRIKVKHTHYKPGQAVDKDNNPVFKNMLVMAASSVDELPDGKRTKGAAMVSHGAGELFGLEVARIDAEIFKSPDKAKELDVTARVTLPSGGNLGLGGFDFHLFKNEDTFAARLNGNAKLSWDNKTIFSKSIHFDVNNSGLYFKFPATCPVQLADWVIRAGFDLRSASNFQINPSIGCSPLDMLQNFLDAGMKFVSLSNTIATDISADTWRGLRDLGGGKINPSVVGNAVKKYGNPANAAAKLADTGKKAADKAVSVVKNLIAKKSKSHPKPIYRDDPKDCVKGQEWSMEYGACWTKGSELIRLAADPRYCISVRLRIREKGKGVEIWKCDGDWYQQWRRPFGGFKYSGIRDGLDGEGYCWEQDRSNMTTESRPCNSSERQQRYHRDGKDRIVIEDPPAKVYTLAKGGQPSRELPFCMTAQTPIVDGSDIQMHVCDDNNKYQRWIFESKDSFK
jgi:hypothetical protein